MAQVGSDGHALVLGLGHGLGRAMAQVVGDAHHGNEDCDSEDAGDDSS